MKLLRPLSLLLSLAALPGCSSSCVDDAQAGFPSKKFGSLKGGITPVAGGGGGAALPSLLYSTWFDGVDEEVGLGEVDTFDGGSAATISFWLKTEEDASTTAIFFRLGTAGGDELFLLDVAASNFRVGVYDSGDVYERNLFPWSWGDNRWHHFAIVIDKSTGTSAERGRLWVDGIEQTTGSATLDGSAFPTQAGGGYIFGSSAQPLGRAADFAMWTTAATEAQVRELYGLGTTGPGIPPDLNNLPTFDPPAHLWRLGTGDTYPTATDLGAVGGFNGTYTNMSLADIRSEDIPGVRFNNYSLVFDATTSDRLDVGQLDTYDDATTWSASAWIRLGTSVDADGETFLSQNFNSGNRVFDVTFLTEETLQFALYGPTTGVWQSGTLALTDDQWHHIVFTFDGAGVTDADKFHAYIDNADVTGAGTFTVTFPTAFPSSSGRGTSNVWVGARTNVSKFWTGEIDDVALWGSELTTTHVTEVYAKKKGANLADLATAPAPDHWWRMGDYMSSATTIPDQGTVGGFDGTLAGGLAFADLTLDTPDTENAFDALAGRSGTVLEFWSSDVVGTEWPDRSQQFVATADNDATVNVSTTGLNEGGLPPELIDRAVTPDLVTAGNNAFTVTGLSYDWTGGDVHYRLLYRYKGDTERPWSMYASADGLDDLDHVTASALTVRRWGGPGGINHGTNVAHGKSSGDFFFVDWVYSPDGGLGGVGRSQLWLDGTAYETVTTVENQPEGAYTVFSLLGINNGTERDFDFLGAYVNFPGQMDLRTHQLHASWLGLATYTAWEPTVVSTWFDGNDERVNLGNVDTLDGGTEGSVAFWFKLNDTDTSGTQKFISNDNGASNQQFEIDLSNTSRFRVAAYDSGTYRSLQYLWTANTAWNHVMAVYNWAGATADDKVKLYLNGVLLTPTSNDHTGTAFDSSGSANLTIAASPSGTLPVGARMVDVAIWDTAATDAHVKEVYNTGSPVDLYALPTFGPPEHWWPLGTGDTHPTATDRGVNSTPFDGTYTNTESTDIQSDVIPGGRFNQFAYDFDGVGDYLDVGTWTGLDGLDKFTVSFWAKTDPADTGTGWLYGFDGTNPITRWRLEGDECRFFVYDGATATYDYINAFAPTGDWEHFVGVYDGTQGSSIDRLKVYRDATEATVVAVGGTVPTTLNAPGDTVFEVGANGAGLNSYAGTMDEFAIWAGVALTPAQIAEVYGNKKGVDLNNLATTPGPSYWSRNGDHLTSETSVPNVGSEAGLAATVTGNPVLVVDTPDTENIVEVVSWDLELWPSELISDTWSTHDGSIVLAADGTNATTNISTSGILTTGLPIELVNRAVQSSSSNAYSVSDSGLDFNAADQIWIRTLAFVGDPDGADVSNPYHISMLINGSNYVRVRAIASGGSAGVWNTLYRSASGEHTVTGAGTGWDGATRPALLMDFIWDRNGGGGGEAVGRQYVNGVDGGEDLFTGPITMAAAAFPLQLISDSLFDQVFMAIKLDANVSLADHQKHAEWLGLYSP